MASVDEQLMEEQGGGEDRVERMLREARRVAQMRKGEDEGGETGQEGQAHDKKWHAAATGKSALKKLTVTGEGSSMPWWLVT